MLYLSCFVDIEWISFRQRTCVFDSLENTSEPINMQKLEENILGEMFVCVCKWSKLNWTLNSFATQNFSSRLNFND